MANNGLLIVLVVALFFMMRRGTMDQKYGTGDPDDDVRENIISYDDEGGGEDDMHAFDITPLRIAVDSNGTMISSRSKQNIFNKPGILKDLRKGTTYDGDGELYGADMTVSGQFIDPSVRLIDGEERDAASRALDDLRNYAYEGCGSTAGSLSSLASIGRDEEGQDFDYLNRLGPRFQNLANLYSHDDTNDQQQHHQ